MPYEFQGENLVYVAPPEVTGYTWTSSGGGADTAPTERWTKNPDFDINSILDIKTDKYGRTVSSLKEGASEADKRAYNLSRNYDPTDFRAATEMQTGISPDWENVRNSGWWNVDPAIQERTEAANRANSGNAVGMSGFKDWIAPLSILAAGAGAAIGTGALAGGAAAGEAAGGAGAAFGGGGGFGGAGTGATFGGSGGAFGGTGAATIGSAGTFGSGAVGAAGLSDAASSGLFNSLGTTPTTTTGTTGMEELLGLTDQAAADANWQQLMAEYNQAGGYAGSYAPEGYGVADGYALGNAAEIANFTGEVAAGALPQSTLSQLAAIAKQYGPTVAKALLGSMTSSGAKAGATGTGGNLLGGLLGAGANYALNQYQLGQLTNAYNANVSAQQAATQQAQQQASFTPVGMTTAFGQSNFQFDPATGKLTAAGYTPSSAVSGQVQNLMGLGAQALPTTADTQAVQQQYITQQQGLLAPSREQQLAQLRNRQYQRGTGGLVTGGTQAGYAPNAAGLMATNPEMAAYYNAQAQQDAALAANAPTYAQNLLNQQIATGTGLFGAANTLEGYAQQPLSLSTSLANASSAAGAKSGYYGLLGNQAALATQLQGQQANIYGTGQALQTASQPLLGAANNIISEWLK